MKSARDVSNYTTLKVLEVYPAVQGEGSRIGIPSTFVRLAGCTVGCDWCDTKYSWKAEQGKDMTPSELLDRVIHDSTHTSVVLTGGEPMEHPLPLVQDFVRMMQLSFHVTIETSAMGIPPEVPLVFRPGPSLLWSLSPKLSSSKTQKPFPDLIEWVNTVCAMDHTMQLKFVISGKEDRDEVLERLRPLEKVAIENGNVDIIFQPCTKLGSDGKLTSFSPQHIRDQIADDLRWLQEVEVAEKALMALDFVGYRIRILPQLHAMLYGNRRGV